MAEYTNFEQVMNNALKEFIAQSSAGGFFLSRGQVDGWLEIMLRRLPGLDPESARREADRIILGMNYKSVDGGYILKNHLMPGSCAS